MVFKLPSSIPIATPAQNTLSVRVECDCPEGPVSSNIVGSHRIVSIQRYHSSEQEWIEYLLGPSDEANDQPLPMHHDLCARPTLPFAPGTVHPRRS